MTYSLTRATGSALTSSVIVKRMAQHVVEAHGDNEAPPLWGILLWIANLAVFLPVIVLVSYSLNHLYLNLAMIEDLNPPAYEAIPANPVDANKINDDGEVAGQSATFVSGKPITSSIRSTFRLLRSVAGRGAVFRGIGIAIIVNIAMSVVSNVLKLLPFIPEFLALLAAAVLTSPLATAWLHYVATPPTREPWYRRLPPYAKTTSAMAVAVVANFLAIVATILLPVLLGFLIGIGKDFEGTVPYFGSGDPIRPPKNLVSAIGKSLSLLLTFLGLVLLLIIPTETAMVRVQASLLSADTDAIVPFDRSFGGRLEPEVVSNASLKGAFARYRAAIASVGRSGWIRLYWINAKILGITVASFMLMAAIVMAESALIVWAHLK